MQDTATIADQRLFTLWKRFGLSGSSEYYGVKPGQQRGASGWDDLRNPRLPLTAQRGAAGGPRLTGPPSAILPAFPENYLPHGNPQVRNEDSGGEKSGGTTDSRSDFVENVATAAGVSEDYFASTSTTTSGGGGGSSNTGMDYYRWLTQFMTGRTIDDSDPDDSGTMGRAIWDAALPYEGAGGWLYDRVNGVTNGALDNFYNNMTPGQYNTAANVAIGVGIITNIAGGVLAGVSGLAGLIGRGIVAGAGMIGNAVRAAGGAIGGLAQVGRGAWSLPNFPRGTLINTLFGGNLISSNFPTIDRFVRGTATSIKSLNLNAKSYRNLSTLNRMLTKYTDSVAGFSGGRWGRDRVPGNEISGRALDLVVPAGTGAQQSVINEIVAYGRSIGVNVNIYIVP